MRPVMPENKRRTRERRGKDKDNPWGSLMDREEASDRETPEEELIGSDDEGREDVQMTEEDEGGDVGWWRRLSVWSILAAVLYLLFIGGLVYTVMQMWVPQEMGDIAGYGDRGPAHDLTLALKNAGGTEISFTEGEINRYLRDTCRMRQGGIFSLVAHEQGVGVRIHDGYAELVIDRLVSTNIHQTTAVHLSFARERRLGRSELRIDFRGGPPILNTMPRGGSIGRVGVPQRYMEMLRPALHTLAECYPEFVGLIRQYGYFPEFVRGRNEAEGRVRLIPLHPSSTD